MTISGSFIAGRAVQRPMAAPPPPAPGHGQKSPPDDAWSPPVEATGQGAPWAEAVQPQMTARGLVLDLGHRWGHDGTPATAAARRPFAASRLLGRRADAPARELDAAQAAAAAAHSDTSAAYLAGHQYQPQPQQTAGAAYGVTGNNVRAIPRMGARVIAHSHGQHVDGDGGEIGPAGFNLGVDGRWVTARYSSPALGALYSRHTLRGVLPKTVAVPANVQPKGGAAGSESGIPSNARWLPKPWVTPALFRSPASESQRTMAAQPEAPEYGPTLGAGVM